ncbi:MAG: MopE-related protein [Deltaproteobacteria bacterium]|nr:MopE-related protein [Deltaproteobacteria bacterium]
MSHKMRLFLTMVLSLLLFSGQAMAVEPGCIDNDGDGHDAGFATYSGGTNCTWSDCNDNDPNIYPGAAEICGNNIDENCNGMSDDSCAIDCSIYDTDGDGFYGFSLYTGQCYPSDCNDNDPLIYPYATEICGNGIDENCNGNFDDTCPPPDNDGDGFNADYDCNDNDPNIYPGAAEICGNGIDENCNGQFDDPCPVNCADYDLDGDGFYGFNPYSSLCFPGDCDDSDPFINPQASEVCDDTKDNNCNGLIDCQDTVCETDPVCIPCTDADGDGYAVEGLDCGPIDCNDADSGIHPGAVEACSDATDNDCDGQIDCADGNCTGSPACPVCVPEVCDDGIDNDCDGKADCSDKGDCRKDPLCTGGGHSEGNGNTCSDGIDNDSDGAVDCADSDCANNKACR